MEAKDNQGNMKDRTKRAAKILGIALLYIGLCVALILSVSPGKEWSGYVGVINGLLLSLLVLSMYCMAVTEPTLRIGKSKRIKISIWLIIYVATIICLFMANGWWESENIGIIYRWILEPMGLYSEGNLTVKILGLIFIATVVAFLLHTIKHIIYKAIDNIETKYGGGENPDAMSGETAQRNSLPGGDGGVHGKATISSEKRGGTTKKTAPTRSGKVIVRLIFATGIIILTIAIWMFPGISELTSTIIGEFQWGSIPNVLLSILNLLISILVSSLSVAVALIFSTVALIAFGFIYKTTTIMFNNIIEWTKGKELNSSEWIHSFIAWVLTAAIVYWIIADTGTGEAIDSFKSLLPGNDFVKSFIAAIVTVTVIWLLKWIIKMIIEVLVEPDVDNNDKEKKQRNAQKSLKAKTKDHLKEIVKKLIDNGLNIIEKAVDLSKNVPIFMSEANSLIDSSENNPDEIEGIIVESKAMALEDDFELESFCKDMKGDC